MIFSVRECVRRLFWFVAGDFDGLRLLASPGFAEGSLSSNNLGISASLVRPLVCFDDSFDFRWAGLIIGTVAGVVEPSVVVVFFPGAVQYIVVSIF